MSHPNLLSYNHEKRQKHFKLGDLKMLSRITEAAKELDCSKELIRKMIKSGKWPSYRIGEKAIRVDVEEIKELGRLMAKANKE
jgi:excisionase family DNA binding protein